MVQCLGRRMKTLDISRKHEHRTIKRFVADSEQRWVRAEMSTGAKKYHLHSSKQIFEAAEKYMKTNFQTVLFIDECHATLDGPDGVVHGWWMVTLFQQG
ncbi:unnamed protein product [Staurois parvus]|uniref:Uncharacterized protein n=1 Tax=Staurois parvus TaxID=386267 RepID=A0ABN9EUN6_9NEOB|nr:unnamed protein product [Staurois parvus]